MIYNVPWLHFFFGPEGYLHVYSVASFWPKEDYPRSKGDHIPSKRKNHSLYKECLNDGVPKEKNIQVSAGVSGTETKRGKKESNPSADNIDEIVFMVS